MMLEAILCLMCFSISILSSDAMLLLDVLADVDVVASLLRMSFLEMFSPFSGCLSLMFSTEML